MYKKLILTFTLAAGLSVLPNAFAAPPPAPGKQRTTTQAPPPKPNTTGTNKHSEDSIDVLAVDITTAPEPKDFKRPGRPPPKGRYGEDSIDVLAAIKARPQPAPPSKPNTTKTINHGEDSVTVLAWKKGPPKGRYGEDSVTVLAWKNEPRPPPRTPRNHGEDSTIV